MSIWDTIAKWQKANGMEVPCIDGTHVYHSKKIIDGLLYNTENAKVVKKSDAPPDQEGITYFVTKNGRFFCAKTWRAVYGHGYYIQYKDIKTVSSQDMKQVLCEHQDTYEKYFGNVENA